MELDVRTLALNLRTLKRGLNRGLFEIPLIEIAWDMDDVRPEGQTGRLHLTVDLEDGALICTGRLEATFVTRCARCLEPAPFSVTEEIAREYTWMPGGNEDDEREVISDTGSLDLLDAVREAVILSMPGKPLCSSDCPGIDYI